MPEPLSQHAARTKCRSAAAWACPALLAAIALCPSAAVATGGTSIATAPTISYGALEGGGGQHQEFFRLPVVTGDKLIFRVDISGQPHSNPLEGSAEAINIYAPTVDDYTLRSSSPVNRMKSEEEGVFLGKSQLEATMSFTGLATVDFEGHEEWAINPYTFSVYALHAAAVSVSAPTVARRGSAITVHAHVHSPAGTPEGTCLIQKLEAPLVNGVCSKRVRLGYGNRQTIRVSFVPNNGWQGASARRPVQLAL